MANQPPASPLKVIPSSACRADSRARLAARPVYVRAVTIRGIEQTPGSGLTHFRKAVNKTILINNLKEKTFDPARALDVQASKPFQGAVVHAAVYKKGYQKRKGDSAFKCSRGASGSMPLSPCHPGCAADASGNFEQDHRFTPRGRMIGKSRACSVMCTMQGVN